MPTERKNESIKELQARVAASPNFFLTDYRGLSVGELRTLRVALRKSSAEYAVIKNTLFGKAIGEDRLAELRSVLEGPTAVAFAGDDPVAAAKALVQFAHESKKLRIKAGIIDGLFYDVGKVEALSKVPTRHELYAKLVGSIKSPLYRLHNVLHGTKRKLVLALRALEQKKSEATSAPA
ncbi:MAG: 50S ribosomal protein L10 [Candidatus Eremiobacteraeota bacterium]|nr:50S ribosomal protein L10 [Candidatus Eremiobacteraeota bacterium]